MQEPLRPEYPSWQGILGCEDGTLSLSQQEGTFMLWPCLWLEGELLMPEGLASVGAALLNEAIHAVQDPVFASTPKGPEPRARCRQYLPTFQVLF